MAPRVGWSSQRIAAHLSWDMPELFANLTRAHIWKWISKSGKKWSKKTKANVARQCSLAGSRRTGILAPYPEIIDKIKDVLTSTRKPGIAINAMIACSIMILIIRKQKPELLDDPKYQFVCAETYIQQFLSSVLNWSIRKGT
ncbi:hypothetical protein JAAARDRAFT_134591 [Jaapia argillacea MUCL 33604]|uniref:Uncharacterized protein n=1 Tax=Jaapia argillacea MUCL 33604 TaxID=933084 RepID=A0A067PLK9_9AGAM|nr:hypothetical protein JAAARDRAFT_134591 [Jaapia argillacea MUCL 33604]